MPLCMRAIPALLSYADTLLPYRRASDSTSYSRLADLHIDFFVFRSESSRMTFDASKVKMLNGSSLNVSLMKLNEFNMTPVNPSIEHSHAVLRLKESTGTMEVWCGGVVERGSAMQAPWLEATLLSSP
jgi:hypothetical protein